MHSAHTAVHPLKSIEKNRRPVSPDKPPRTRILRQSNQETTGYRCHAAATISFPRIFAATNLFHWILNFSTVLDASYNKIREIECVSNLRNLQRLYLASNRLTEIKGLDNCESLTYLDLGSNRIRVCLTADTNCARTHWAFEQKMQNLAGLTQLRELWLGKNRIESISDELCCLTSLVRLDLQVVHNRCQP